MSRVRPVLTSFVHVHITPTGTDMTRALTASALLVLAACPPPPAAAPPAQLVDLVDATAAECSTGGKKVLAGADANANGTLDADEVSKSTTICNGARGGDGTPGGRGLTALIRTAAEPTGANCPAGGTRLDVGLDDDGNGTLEAGEVDSTSYLCNGGSGQRSLLRVSTEPAGANCPAGGRRLESGLDDDGDSTLDPNEVDATSYVCDATRSLVAVRAEAAGTNCAQGGSRVDSGPDTNGNGMLDTSEVAATSYVCNGAGGGGTGSLIRSTPETGGTNCPLGGVRLDSGTDANSNGMLETSEISSTAYVCNSGVPFAIQTAMLGAGALGSPYAATITAAGGTNGGYQWSISSGTLPPGLTLATSGTPSTTLSGSPTMSGSFTFTVRVVDFFGQATTRSYGLTVSENLRVTSFVFPRARSGAAYSATLTATGGTTPYTWSVVAGSGALPAGVTLSAGGVLAGTPTSRLGASFTAQVTDMMGATARVRVIIGGDERLVAFTGDLTVDGTQEVYLVDASGPTPATPVAVSTNATGANGLVSGSVVFSPDYRWLAYRADYDQDSFFELYVVNVSGATPGPQVKVNGPLLGTGTTGGDVLDFEFSPNGQWLAYRADQDVDVEDELFLVDLSGTTPGTPVQVNAPLVTNGDVLTGYRFSPDSTKLAYVADQDTDAVNELFIATVSATPTRVRIPMPATGDVSTTPAPLWTLDSANIIYRADATTDDVIELNISTTTGTPVTSVLSGTMQPSGDLGASSTDIGLSPLGDRLYFVADRDIEGLDQVYVVRLGTTPSAPVLVSPATTNANLDVLTALWSPDGTRLAIHGDFDLDLQDELFVVDTAAPTPVPVKVNQPLGTNTNSDVLAGYQWLPDGSGLVFRADPTVDVSELFLVRLAAPGVAVRLNQTLLATSDVDAFTLTENGDTVAFLADPTVASDDNVYVVNLSGATPTAPAQVNATLTGGDVFSGFQFRGDSRTLLYRSDELVDADNEFFMSVVSAAGAPGAPQRLNPTLAAGGDVGAFATQP
jgi:Tol biopolymer transport system component